MNLQKLQLIRFEAFKTQNPELGAFDVTFDIGGKTILAHKFMLLPVSTTFSSMISDRWTSKDVPIPLDTYGYEDFYQFFTFLYSGECELTNNNIFTMVDIAEFYQVALFKEYCQEFVSKLECNVENVFQLLEIASKYKLDSLKKLIVPFIETNFLKLFSNDEQFQISRKVLLQLTEMGWSLSVKDEKAFEKVYDWAEKQAMAKMESDSNLNLNEAIKEILADFMPLFDFVKMNHSFVINFIAAKSILPPAELSSLLSKTYAQTFCKVKVEITDAYGKIMEGVFFDPGNIYDEIQKTKNNCYGDNNYLCWKTSCENRPSQNILKENDGIEWYLIYDCFNDFNVKRRSNIRPPRDYLIAEMFPEDGFVLNRNCKIRAIRL